MSLPSLPAPPRTYAPPRVLGAERPEFYQAPSSSSSSRSGFARLRLDERLAFYDNDDPKWLNRLFVLGFGFLFWAPLSWVIFGFDSLFLGGLPLCPLLWLGSGFWARIKGDASKLKTQDAAYRNVQAGGVALVMCVVVLAAQLAVKGGGGGARRMLCRGVE